jgi:CRP-like cAMP-binding protein
MNLLAFLKALPAFSALTPGGLAAVLRVTETKDYADGAKIIARGEPGDAMYIIFTGEARVPILDANGNERMVAKLAPGTFFGEMSLITGEPRAADVFAVGPVKAIRIQKDAFLEITKKIPSLARFLTEVLVARLAQSDVLSSKLIGRYKLLDQIGRGETSIVYNAMHTVLNKQVAVKMLSHRLALDDRFRAMFQEEAQTIATLDHENIVKVFEVEQAYATYFIIAEYVGGVLLAKRIESSGPLEDNAARDVLVQLCRALGHAHERGVYHRDLTPTKVMLDGHGRVKLMDFGLAYVHKPAAAPTAEIDVVGTPEFMAPEQLRGTGFDRRSDIYALGVVAYVLTTGEVPLIDGNPFDPKGKHLTEPFPSPLTRRGNVAPELAAFVERATQKDPAKRYQTMEEALAALSRTSEDAVRIAGMKGYNVTILCRASEASRVEAKLEELRLELEPDPNIHFGSSVMTLK